MPCKLPRQRMAKGRGQRRQIRSDSQERSRRSKAAAPRGQGQVALALVVATLAGLRQLQLWGQGSQSSSKHMRERMLQVRMGRHSCQLGLLLQGLQRPLPLLLLVPLQPLQAYHQQQLWSHCSPWCCGAACSRLGPPLELHLGCTWCPHPMRWCSLM